MLKVHLIFSPWFVGSVLILWTVSNFNFQSVMISNSKIDVTLALKAQPVLIIQYDCYNVWPANLLLTNQINLPSFFKPKKSLFYWYLMYLLHFSITTFQGTCYLFIFRISFSHQHTAVQVTWCIFKGVGDGDVWVIMGYACKCNHKHEHKKT